MLVSIGLSASLLREVLCPEVNRYLRRAAPLYETFDAGVDLYSDTAGRVPAVACAIAPCTYYCPAPRADRVVPSSVFDVQWIGHGANKRKVGSLYTIRPWTTSLDCTHGRIFLSPPALSNLVPTPPPSQPRSLGKLLESSKLYYYV